MDRIPGGEIPDEIKNQIVDGKKRVITENIPQRYLDDVEDENKKHRKASQEYFYLSRQNIKIRKRIEELAEKLTHIEGQKKKIYEQAFKKMKLGKKKDYNWQIKGNDFVGILNVTPPVPPKKEN